MMKAFVGKLVDLVLLLFAIVAIASCAPRDRVAPTPVGSAWEAQTAEKGEPVGSGEELAATTAAAGPAGLSSPPEGTIPAEPPIATVDGRAIARHRVVDLLLRGHGAGVLEQLIVLGAAEALSAERGLTVTAQDFDREYERALRHLVDPLAELTGGAFDREAAEGVLDTVLSNRNISGEEFRIGIRRNTYLRAIVEADQAVTEEQLRIELERTFGPRLRVRHIQLATRGEAARTQERLAAGEDFADLAKRYSANLSSAETGGLLEPFSVQDQDVPALLRDTASRLEPGQVSAAIRIGQWYHILRLDERLPAQEVEFETVRQGLEGRLRDRLAEPAMRDLYESLITGAAVRIHDPVLRAAYERKHPTRNRP